jgi:hypothetical protein
MINYIKTHVLGCVAIFLALAGTASATHLQVFSSDIVDGEVKTLDVQNNGLTGSDIAENTLSVPGMGCQNGKVKGYARVKGTNGIPGFYTNVSAWIDRINNCSGGAVQVRRASTGVYYVRFIGNPSAMAVATSNSDGFGLESVNNDNIVSVAKVTSGADTGAFRVEVQDVSQFASAGSDPQDGQLSILLF